jgi:DNA-binding beta-propeller fold protein YncE
VTRPLISRRSLLLTSAAAMACGARKSAPFHGFCFVANRGSKTVAVVDLEQFRVRRQIALDSAPAQILSHPKGAPQVYVLAPDSGTVYEISSSTLAVGRRAKVGNQAVSMLMSPAGDSLWVLYRDPAQLVELPLKTLQPGARISLPAEPDSFDVSFDPAAEPRAIVCCRQNRTVSLVDPRKSTQHTMQVPIEPSLASFRRDGELLMVGSRPDRDLLMVDSRSGKTVVRLPLAVAPRYFQQNSDGWLFITGEGADGVVIVFPYSTEVWQTLQAGRAPGVMAISEGEGTAELLLVANPDSNSVTVLDYRFQKLVAVIGVGMAPGQILLTGGKSDEQYALVLNEKSGDMAVIRMLELNGPQISSKPRFKSAALLTMIPVGEEPVSGGIVAL